MSNVSIYDKNWNDLVFEGKNKTYGAYQLRQDSSRTTFLALLLGILCFASIAGVITLISSFTTADAINKPVLPDVIHVTKVYIAPKKLEPKKQKLVLPLRKEKVKEKITAKELINPKVVKKEDKPDDVAENKNVKPQQPDTDVKGQGTVVTTLPITTGGDATGKGKGTEGDTKSPGTVNTTNELDVMPEFPGGIKEFQRYISRNIDKPDMDESMPSITAIVSFVIEKDGGLSDIKVLRSNDKELEKAAVKVLKSLHTKWKPGMKDGDYVRTLYIQPIRIAL
jgi:protein TonB